MKKIKNIVVATDFSVTARHAYDYAVELANSLEASLTVVHVKEDLIIIGSDVMVTPISSTHDSQLKNDIKELIAEEDVFADYFLVKQDVKIKILSGNPVNALTQLSKDNETDLIVIGTTGLSDVLTKIFGSVSLNLSNKAHCPVILVPRDAKWQPVNKIMFASNFDSMTPELSHEIIDFAVNLKADIHFVNVRNYDPLFEAKQKDIDWNKLFVGANFNLPFEKHTIYGNDTVEELKKYSEEKNINLIAFASKHRNFWERLVHKSITVNMALSTTLPLLVMHLEDEL